MENEFFTRAKQSSRRSFAILLIIFLVILGGVYLLLQANQFLGLSNKVDNANKNIEDYKTNLVNSRKELNSIVSNTLQRITGTEKSEAYRKLSTEIGVTGSDIGLCDTNIYYAEFMIDAERFQERNLDLINQYGRSDQDYSLCLKILLDITSTNIYETDSTERQEFLEVLNNIYKAESGDYFKLVSVKLLLEDMTKLPGYLEAYSKVDGEHSSMNVMKILQDDVRTYFVDDAILKPAIKRFVEQILNDIQKEAVGQILEAHIQHLKSFHAAWHQRKTAVDEANQSSISDIIQFPEGVNKYYLIQVTILRVGVVLLLIFLVSILVPLYKYQLQLAAYYYGLYDIVRMSKKDLHEWPFETAASIFIPKVEMTKEPSSPAEALVKLFRGK